MTIPNILKAPDETLIKMCNGTTVDWHDERITELNGNYNTFYGTPLNTVELPNLKVLNGKQMFALNSLKYFEANNLEVIDSEGCFASSAIEEFNAPKLKNIPDYCFNKCGYLKKLNISSVETIGTYAIGSSDKQIFLDELDLKSLVSADAYAFYGNITPKKVWIPSTCIQLGAYALLFYDYELYKVFIEHPSRPSGWASNWNNGWSDESYMFIWGATYEEYLAYGN